MAEHPRPESAPLPAAPVSGDGAFALRAATLDDVDALERLEGTAFSQDRIGRRQFRWMIRRANAELHVALDGMSGGASGGEPVAGYVLVLFHKGTSLARLYSLAVDAGCRGRGLGRQLMERAEALAREHGCVYLRLEVAPANRAAIALYEDLGYRPFGLLNDYYQDHSDALRYEKRIQSLPEGIVSREVPYYEQTLDFTCGPASLLMAMGALRPGLVADRALEIRLWREATTVYMTAGHGGCGPHGLALAARRRGFGVRLLLSESGPLFLDGVRREDKKAVMRIVHEDFVREVAETDIEVRHGDIGTAALVAELDAGNVPLVLISSYRFDASKAPHWVVLAAADARFVYVHDPHVDVEHHKSRGDTQYVPVARPEFERMIRFGRARAQAALCLWAIEDRS